MILNSYGITVYNTSSASSKVYRRIPSIYFYLPFYLPWLALLDRNAKAQRIVLVLCCFLSFTVVKRNAISSVLNLNIVAVSS